jgi:ABC-2 type transport system permease protein
MKTLRSFIRKETFHILRDTRSLVIIIGLPLVQVILFGFAITNEIKDARIAVYDPAGNDSSRDFIHQVVASDFFELDTLLQRAEDLESIFQSRPIKMALVLPPDFGSRLPGTTSQKVQVITDASDPNTATTLVQYTEGIVRSYQQQLNRGLTPSPPLQVEVKMLYNEQLKSVYYFVPGVMTVILMLVSAMMTSISLTREKELGTMEVLLASPIRPLVVIVGKVIPYVALSFFNTLLILALAFWVFDMPVKGDMTLLLLECFLFIMTSLALGIFISTRTDSQQVALLISLMGLMLPTILLSGFIFPVENMPFLLQTISKIIPASWFLTILKGVMLKGVGLEFLWQETLVLVGMTLFLILLSVKNYKIRLA